VSLARESGAATTESPEELVTRWQQEAKLFRLRGLTVQADFVESYAADLIAAIRARADLLVDLREASRISGYSRAHLVRLIHKGKLRDGRAPGSRGRIYVRLSDLPSKPGSQQLRVAGVHELASRLFGGKEGHHGRS
jgi:hypothetical protein